MTPLIVLITWLFSPPAFAESSLSVIKIARDGNVRSVSVVSNGLIDSPRKPKRPCLKITIRDFDLGGGKIVHTDFEGDAELLSLNDRDLQICVREKSITLNLDLTRDKQLSDHHYVVESFAEAPSFLIDESCKKEKVEVYPELLGAHLATGLYCIRNEGNLAFEKLNFELHESVPGSSKFRPASKGVLTPLQKQTVQVLDPGSDQLGIVALTWIPEAPPPPAEIFFRKSLISIYLGLSYHSHQNQFVNSIAGSQTFTGMQTRVAGNGYLRSDWLGGVLFRGNLESDVLSRSLLHTVHAWATVSKRVIGAINQSEGFVGVGGGALGMFGSANYGVVSAMTPVLEFFYLSKSSFEAGFSYAPILVQSISPTDAIVNLFVATRLRWFNQNLKLGVTIDYTSAKAANIGGIADYRSFGGSIMIGKELGEQL